MERRLAAVLVADLAGYSKLMGADDAGTLQRLKACEQAIVIPVVESHAGKIVKRTGDEYLIEFPSVVKAAKCAVAWQQAMADSKQCEGLRFRIGIDLGDVIDDDGDIYGDGINIAARLEALAVPGGICLSGAVKDQLSGQINLAVEPLGVQELKNISRPVAVYRLTPQAAPVERAEARVLGVDLDRPERPSVAVLPFQNMSAEPEQEFFADGLTEDIITRLSYLRDLLVISRTSAFAYKGRLVEVRDVGRELGVRHVLEGSVRKAGNRVRITAQLVDCNTGGHVWAQRYDRDLTDIFAIQDEITHSIVVAMQAKLTDGELARIGAGGTKDVEAWELFLQGAQSLLKYTKEDMAEARRMFERALARDPAYLDAKVYLAWTHWIDARYGDVPDRGAAVAEARRLFEAVKSVDPSPANARHLEAALLILERRHDEALAAARNAVEVGPCKIFGYAPSALIHMYCGDVSGSLDLLRTTVRLSPFCPSDAVYYIAYALVWLGRVEEAVAVAGEYARRVPADRYAYTLLAIANIFAGDQEAARSAVRELRRLYPAFNCTEFAAHELYRDPADLDRVVTALLDAGLPS